MAAKPLRFRVSFDDVDKENIVFFGNFFRMAHRALEAFLPQIGIPWEDWFAHQEWGVPVRRAEADYQHPLWPNEEFDAHIQVAKIGDSSITFVTTLQKTNGEVAAKVTTTHVFLSRKTRQKISVPDVLRERLKPYLIP